MPSPLIAVKTHIPYSRGEYIKRPRLLDRLKDIVRRKLTLICTPAEFGKTTLAGNLLKGISEKTAWVSLDESDNDLVRFILYTVKALQSVDASIGAGLQDLIHSDASYTIDVLAAGLIDDLVGYDRECILVYDDYHSIHLSLIHEFRTLLLDNLPPRLHLVVISRSTPPLPIAKLRARNDLVELTASDLRFNRMEAESFFRQVMKLDLAEEEVGLLEERTKGWAVGLQLAALSLSRERPIQFGGIGTSIRAAGAGRNRLHLRQAPLVQIPLPDSSFVRIRSI